MFVSFRKPIKYRIVGVTGSKAIKRLGSGHLVAIRLRFLQTDLVTVR